MPGKSEVEGHTSLVQPGGTVLTIFKLEHTFPMTSVLFLYLSSVSASTRIRNDFIQFLLPSDGCSFGIYNYQEM